ncbi:MAG: hypothetical protein ACLQU4_19425 [Limisphaerales bacterium]
MSRVFVHGQGAVSPAGWGVPALRACLEQGRPLPVQSVPRPGWDKPLPVRAVPPPPARPAFLAHARLRRASPMAHHVVGAALEALGGDEALVSSGALRLGIVSCTMTGGLSYSRRFYQEVMQDPAQASPLLFSETVFNAPASHLAAYLDTSIVNYTLVGDAGAFLQGLAIAAQWLEDGVADACLVIGAEESDWTAADALRLFERHSVHTAGAGALYLKAQPPATAPVELAVVTDSFTSTCATDCGEAARRMRAQLPVGAPTELLCSNESDNVAWSGWSGGFLTPKPVLGEAFAALAAWQCAAACDAIEQDHYEAANVSITGARRQTIVARFVKPKYPTTESGQPS